MARSSISKARLDPADARALWKSSAGRMQDHDRKREAIVLTAARAFRERGYHNTSLDDIASQLRITKPTVYHYVKTKERLLFECFRTGLTLIMEGLEQARQTPGPARDRLYHVIQRYAAAITSDFGWCMVQAENQDLSAAMSAQIKSLKSRIDQGMRQLLEDGAQDGSLRPCDPKITSFALAGALNWIAHWYRSNERLSADDIAARMIELFDLGLGPR
jgi:AcrR family transcriptional regulator